MKYLLTLLLLIPNTSYAQNQVDNIILELSFQSCRVGYFQSFLDSNTTPSQEQLKHVREFCIAFSKSILKKIKEDNGAN